MRLGIRLRDIREQRGLTTRQLAKLLDVTEWQIRVVESGQTIDPSLGYVWRCANAYGLTLADLLVPVDCPRRRHQHDAVVADAL